MIGLIMITWTALASLLLTLASQSRTANRMQMSAVAMGLAEGGVVKALWESARGAGYKGEEDTALETGTFSVSVKREGGQLLITATGWIPSKARARFSQSVRVVASPGGGVLNWQKL
jgi:hypothetical protein